MINNKGFGKFEVLTVIVLLMGVCAYFMYTIVQGSSKEDFQTMKNDAVKLSNVVTVNENSFRTITKVYLGEVINEGLMKEIKSPVSKGSCSNSESFVSINAGKAYATLRCGNYLIDNTNVSNGTDGVVIYEVSDWNEQKQDTDNDEKILYNCLENGVEKYPEYYEDLYFTFMINKEYTTDYYSVSGINECEVVSKTFYRTKSEYDPNAKKS